MSAGKLLVRRLEDFLTADLPQVEKVLDPWLPVDGLAMIAGQTGLGKTFLAMACALAIASGGEVLGWKAPKPRRVLYVDGEMSVSEMQERAKRMSAGIGDPKTALDNLFFLFDGDQEDGIPNLSEFGGLGQLRIERAIAETKAEVIFLDNLSALCNSDAENDTESWVGMQDWLRALRREHKTVVFLHHTGKPTESGWVKQRGTSKREDILNTTMLLKSPFRPDHQGRTPEGEFDLIFTKHRGFLPGPMRHVQIIMEEEKCSLLGKTGEEALEPRKINPNAYIHKVGHLLEEGKTIKEAASVLGISETQAKTAEASYRIIHDRIGRG